MKCARGGVRGTGAQQVEARTETGIPKCAPASPLLKGAGYLESSDACFDRRAGACIDVSDRIDAQ